MKDFDSINEPGEILSEHAICYTLHENIIADKGFIDPECHSVYVTNSKNNEVLACCEGIVSVRIIDKQSVNEGDVLYIDKNGCATNVRNNYICGIAMSNNKTARNGENIVSMLIDFVKLI